MPLTFKGVAHPAPRRDGKRNNVADLNRAEISALKMGRNGGTDLLVEHDPGSRVGSVIASWEGPHGELRVEGVVHDNDAMSMVKDGGMRGLSLGTGVQYGEGGRPIWRNQDELSLCETPRRGGCYIDEVNGQRVRSSYCASGGVLWRGSNRRR